MVSRMQRNAEDGREKFDLYFFDLEKNAMIKKVYGDPRENSVQAIAGPGTCGSEEILEFAGNGIEIRVLHCARQLLISGGNEPEGLPGKFTASGSGPFLPAA